jgi:hypothetical protein
MNENETQDILSRSYLSQITAAKSFIAQASYEVEVLQIRGQLNKLWKCNLLMDKKMLMFAQKAISNRLQPKTNIMTSPPTTIDTNKIDWPPLKWKLQLTPFSVVILL